MKSAVILMVSQSDIPAYLEQARRLLEQAAAGGARLAVLPENFAAMGRRDSAAIGRAEAPGGLTLDSLQSCLLYTSPSPRDLSTSRMPSSA